VLEDAGYVEVRKGAVGRRPRTWFRLTAEGRQAVQGHLAWLAQLEEAFSGGTRDARQPGPLTGDRDQPRHVLPPLLGSS
jgi:DNA-binding PadR family transcriptional regulator